MIKNYFKTLFFVVFFVVSFQMVFTNTSNAEFTPAPDLGRLKNVGMQAGFDNTPLESIKDQETLAEYSIFYLSVPIVYILEMVYGFLGIILALLVINGGYVWLTAQGNEEKVTRARQILQRAAVGFALLVGSVIIIYFVLLVLGQVDPEFIQTSGESLR